MILRTTTGRSFKGVGQYVLHDKDAQTNDRVSFVETENLAFTEGNRAIAEMVHTAVRQKEIKRQNGLRATQTSKPVYHLSLSWDTSENPSLKEQMDAAREAVKALGMADHQMMIVGHTDTDNPHVHAVVNLVNPTTGKTASLSNDQLKLSKWAEQYRRDRGQEHLCPQRKKNNDRRANGEFVKADNLTRQEWIAWKKGQTAEVWKAYREDRDQARADRKGQYDALWQQKEERFALRKDEIKQVFKPYWRDLFKAQRQELREFDNHLVSRMKFALRQSKEGKVKAMFQAVFSDPKQRMELIAHHEKIRADLSHTQKGRIGDASREVTKAWKYDRDQLKILHKTQDQERLDQARSTTDAMWKDRTKPTAQDITRIRTKDTATRGFDDTADRRKDDETRSVFDEELSKNPSKKAPEQEREKVRSRRERNRNRPRRGKGGGRKMKR